MNIFSKTIDKIGGFFSKAKSFVTEEGGQWFTLFNEYGSRDLTNLSKSEYLKFYMGRAFVAISTIAEDIGGLERQVVDKNGKAVKHEYEKLIDFDLLVNISSFMDLQGACYVRKNTVGGKVKELIVLRPDLVDIVRDSQQVNVVGYNYRKNANQKAVFLKVDEVMAFTNFSPYAPYPQNYTGMPTVQAIAVAIDTDYQASKRNRKYFHNNASVPGVLETDADIDEDVVDQISKAREQKYRGTNNAHKIGILTGGLKYKPLSPSQKEMDFVESRRFNRDEILGFFKVPKAMLGLGEGGTAMNVRSFDMIFSKRTILPRSRNIQQIFNQELFGDEFTFEFINIVPADLAETRNDYVANGITLNEFRSTRGYAPMKNGDRLRSEIMYDMIGQATDPSNTPEPDDATDEEEQITTEALGQFTKENKQLNQKIETAIRNSLAKDKKTDSYREKQREQKIDRNNRYESRYNEKLQTIFSRQEKEIIAGFKKRYKGTKSIKSDIPVLKIAKRTTVYNELLKSIQNELVVAEATQALIQVNVGIPFSITSGIEKKLKENITRFAGEVDTVTNKKIEKVLTNVLDQGQTVEQGVEQLQGVFSELKTTRATAIVRTETIRAGNQSSQLARDQSGVVEQKQWFTALDERTCEFCGPLHGKIIGLGNEFFKKGTTLEGISEDGNSVSMNLDYSDVDYPPLHPNCRCVIIPILSS